MFSSVRVGKVPPILDFSLGVTNRVSELTLLVVSALLAAEADLRVDII